MINTKISSSEKLSKKIFLIGLIVCMGLFMVSFTSAFNFNDNLKFYLNLDEASGTTAYDGTSTYNFTNTGAVGINQPGLIGKSYKFNGTTGNYLTNSTPYSSVEGADFAWNFWVKNATGSESTARVIAVTGGTYMSFIDVSTNSVRGYFNELTTPAGASAHSTPYDPNFTADVWHMVTINVLYNASGLVIETYTDGVLRETDISAYTLSAQGKFYFGNILGETQSFTGYLDEVGVWNRSLTSAEVTELYNGGDGISYGDLIYANIKLESPTNGTILSTIGANFTSSGINISSVDYEWKNITYYVWENYTIFNETFIDITDSEVFNETQFIDSFTLGDYEWNVYSCYGNATFNNCTWAESNSTFEVGASLVNQTYNNVTFETSNELFSISVTLLEDSEISLSKLIYNDIEYIISNITLVGDTYKLSRKIDIPLNTNPFADQINNFSWEFTYNGGETQTLTGGTQNVSFINLQQCNATYIIQSLNFTFYEELNQTNLNATTYPVSLLLNFDYWLGSGDIKKQYVFENLSSTINNFQFCISENETFKTDMDMQYYAGSYVERTYYFRNYTINNVSNDILLYNLLITEATKFSINLKQGTDVFTNAVVSVWKYFVGLGDYRITMIGLTDDKGKFSANLDLDQTYNFTIFKDNYDYGGFIKQASCASSPCEIDINIGEIELSGFADLERYFAQYIEITPEDEWNNKTAKTISIDFLDTLGTSNYWRLYVYMPMYDSEDIIDICDVKIYSSAGNLFCNYSNYTGDIVAKLYISRSPEKLVDFINFVNNNAPEIFGVSAILASVIIILVIFFAGAKNPAIALVLIPFALVILKFIGFIPLDWTWIAGLSIFILWIAHKVNT